MKRWIHSATEASHQWHIDNFNKNYSAKCPHRITDKGRIYFTQLHPVDKFVQNYNETNEGAELSIATNFVERDGYEYARYAVV